MRSNCSGHEVVTHLSPEKEEENRSTEIATEIAPTEIATWAQSAQQQLLPPLRRLLRPPHSLTHYACRAARLPWPPSASTCTSHEQLRFVPRVLPREELARCGWT